MGDPGGIGPEIIVKSAIKLQGEVTAGRMELLVVGSAAALAQACGQVGVTQDSLPLRMIDVGPVGGDIVTGQISAVGGEWAYQVLN